LAKGEADEFESGSQNNFNDDFNDDDGWIGKSKYVHFFGATSLTIMTLSIATLISINAQRIDTMHKETLSS